MGISSCSPAATLDVEPGTNIVQPGRRDSTTVWLDANDKDSITPFQNAPLHRSRRIRRRDSFLARWNSLERGGRPGPHVLEAELRPVHHVLQSVSRRVGL